MRLPRFRLHRLRDLISDVAEDLSAKPARLAIMLVAIAVSVGSLIAAEAVSASSAKQITDQLASTALEHVTVAQESEGHAVLTPESAQSAADVTQVLAAQTTIAVQTDDHPVRRLAHSRISDDIAVIGTGETLFFIMDATLSPQHVTGAWSSLSARRVAIVGTAAAEQLGVTAGAGATIHIGSDPYSVLATADSKTNPEVNRSVYIPYEAAAPMAGSNRPEVVVRTTPGASTPVASVLPKVLSPANPSALTTRGAEGFGELRRGVSTSLDGLLRSLGIMLWLLTLMIVTNTMVTTVMSRTPEIGLRRALGFSRGDIAAKFTAEATVVGVLGGLGGIGLGCAAAVGVATIFGWTPQFPIWLAAAGPALGALTGIAAAAYPAWRASRVRPSEAVRSD